MSTKRGCHSRRQRPAVYWALLELSTLADAWLDLDSTRKVRGCRGQIMSSLLRALTALTQASAGRRTSMELATFRTALDRCESGFMILHKRVPKIADEALRRIDQIVATSELFEGVDPLEWLKVELVPLRPEEPDEKRTDTLVAALRTIAERVSLVWKRQVADLREGSEAPPDEAQPPPPKKVANAG